MAGSIKAVFPVQDVLPRFGCAEADDRVRTVGANSSAAPPRLTVVAQEIPYPPTHGGRVDMWRRLEAFVRAGVRTQLIYWSAEAPDDEALAAIARVSESSCALTFKQDWPARLRTASRLFSAPAPAGTRMLNPAEHHRVYGATRVFQPDAIWLDQLYGAELARGLATAMAVPLLTRSHNIEHCYWRDQLKAARGMGQQARIRARLLSLERFELSVLRASHRFYDISIDDLAYWQQRGLRNGRWLPPLADQACFSAARRNDLPARDIGFVGNLFMPNNVEAVEWLLRQVLPVVRAQLPQATVLIAGSQPGESLRKLIAADPLVELRANIRDPAAAYRDARVLVNPMLRGSGVALKSIDMLASGRDLVSTSQGVTGLPPLARECFLIADSADGFSRAIVAQLRGLYRDDSRRNEAMKLFSDDAIGVVIDDIREIVGSYSTVSLERCRP